MRNSTPRYFRSKATTLDTNDGSSTKRSSAYVTDAAWAGALVPVRPVDAQVIIHPNILPAAARSETAHAITVPKSTGATVARDIVRSTIVDWHAEAVQLR